MLKPASCETRAVGYPRSSGPDRWPSGVREWRDERVPALREGHPLAVGRRHDLRRILRLEMHYIVAARQRGVRIADSDADQDGLALARIVDENALPGVPWPLATSTRQILPSPQMTIACPSGSHAYRG